jgi:hypothetical protein
MRELRLWAAAAAGPAVAATFSALAALRRKRSLHPTGVGYQGVLQVPAKRRLGRVSLCPDPPRPTGPCFASLGGWPA